MSISKGLASAFRALLCTLAIGVVAGCDDASTGGAVAHDAGQDVIPDGAAEARATDGEVDVTDTGDGGLGGTHSERQLVWVLDVLNGPAAALTTETVASHFSASAVLALPAPALAAALRQSADELRPFVLLSTTPQRSGLIAALRARNGVYVRFLLSVDPADGKIAGLLLQPATDLDPNLESFSSISARLQAVGTKTAIALSTLDGPEGTRDGGTGDAADAGTTDAAAPGAADAGTSGGGPLACRTLAARNADEALPLGSLFKIYVLGAVIDRVQRGQTNWTDTFPIEEKWKSLPSGVLQDRPAGTPIAVDDAVAKMISISDNTATDHLIHWLGRDRVEAQQTAMGHSRADLNVPFLTTRDMFTLKLALSPAERQSYIAAGPVERRRQLDEVIALTPIPVDLDDRVATWTTPRDVDTLEWFADTGDICRAFASLAAKFDVVEAAPAIRALALNPGIAIDRNVFTYAGFKGGSEPGVLTLSWLLRRRADSAWRVVTVMATDATRDVPSFTTVYFAGAAVTLAGR